MSWTPQLVALDMDGTIVDFNDRVREDCRQMIAEITRQGVPVVLATGRGWHATWYHADTLQLPRGPHVTSNGAVLVTYPPLHLDEIVTFNPRETIETVVKEHPRCLIAVEVVGQGYKVNAPFPDGELSGTIDVVSNEELAATMATRVVLRDPAADDGVFEAMAARMGLSEVSYFIGTNAWIDICPQGINKAHGLEKVCRNLGIHPDDVLAMGDGMNDIEMFQFAGRAVAMGNARDEVKAAADAVTGRFEHGGAVAELRRWF